MDKRAITAEDLYRFVWLSDPAVNPQDGTIAYVSKQVNEEKSGYRSRIHITAADGTKSKAFTHGEQDSAPVWVTGRDEAGLRAQEGEAPTDVDDGCRWRRSGSDYGRGVRRQRICLVTGRFPPVIYIKHRSGQESREGAAGDGKKKPGKQALVVDRLKCKADGKGLLDGKRTHLFVFHPESARPFN